MTEAERTERTEELHEKVRRSGRFLKAITWIFGGAVVIAVISTVIIQGYQLSSLSHVSDDTRRNSDRLVDCTTPGGKCYEQGRSASSGAVGTINKATIAAIWCSGKLGPGATIQQLQLCVKAQIK